MTTTAETATTPETPISFPRQYARTQRFTLGAPRMFAPAPDGQRVAFLRTPSGTERPGCLWVYDVVADEEKLVADPRQLLAADDEENLSFEERRRRERHREGGAGIVAYATDRARTVAVFALSSRLFVARLDGAGLDTGDVRELPATGPVVDPRPDPTGRHVAYVADKALRVIGTDGTGDRALVEADGEQVTVGLVDYSAAENTIRYRGYWWSPDGESLLVARVDETPVQRWHIADPANPAIPATEVAYPAAGTPNAEVSLSVVRLDGSRIPVEWDNAEFPYLADISWTSYGPPLLPVFTRDQRRARTLALDPATGATSVVEEATDPSWVDAVPGFPAWSPDGKLISTREDYDCQPDTRRLTVGGEPVTPPSLQVDALLDINDAGMLFSASTDPTESHLWSYRWDGTLEPLTKEPGLHGARRAGDLLLVSRSSMENFGSTARLFRKSEEIHTFASYAETPSVTPRVSLLRAGARALRTAVVLPTGWQPGGAAGPLPVLLDPYGGPHTVRTVAARNAYLSSQWLADQGFAVIIADGRGTPGRGPRWDREVAFDLAGPVLQDQVDALHAVAERQPGLDLSRVAIRGWSFGGYLAALAVLRRPDVFAAGIAGAPVTDWALYDTHYSERYLGMPQEHPEAYERTSLLTEAPKLERPLLLIHGMADDNVVAAHTLRLSSALLEAGRPHTVLPLSGVTHMTPQEVVAENLLLLQVDFLRQALALPPSPTPPTPPTPRTPSPR